MRIILLSFILLSLLFLPAMSFALTLSAPNDGATEVDVDEYFVWEEVSGAARYVLDISKFTQSEDNIPFTKCASGVCSFGFLEFSAGSIEYSDSYTWRISAYSSSGSVIGTPSDEWSFSTKQPPTTPPPPPGTGQCNNDGHCDDGEIAVSCDDCPVGPGPPGPIGGIFQIENPISSNTPQEFVNKLIDFLFGLAIVLAPLSILYAGFMMLTAAGDPAKLGKARSILIWTFVAFAIILVAKGAPNVIRSIL